jgi:hypothetical protein
MGKEESQMGQDLASTEHIRALVFVLQLKTAILAHTFLMFKFVI